MTEALKSLKDPQIKVGRARRALIRRLIDVVALPSSRLPPQDRAMASDILLEMLLSADVDEVRLCAQRIADKSEAPRRLLRFLAASPIDIARLVLEDNTGIEETDLAHVAMAATPEHRLLIAKRKNVGPMLGDVLIDFAEPPVIKALLRNPTSVLSDVGLDGVLALSRDHTMLCPLLINRPEVTPAHMMAMFWWAEAAERQTILTRHAADRMELIAACSDVFPMMAQEKWADEIARKGLQLIERRQRNRDAIESSEFVNLEHAVEEAAKSGLNAKLAQEIGYLAGVKPITIAKILSDTGGEGIAVLCKATGLKSAYLKLLWKAMRRQTELNGEIDRRFKQVTHSYQILTVAKAQTILRYWNWSLSSAYSPRIDKTGDDDNAPDDTFAAARRTAGLVFGSN